MTMKVHLTILLLCLFAYLAHPASIRSSLRSRSNVMEEPEGGDPPATPPSDDNQESEDDSNDDPLQNALGSIKKTEANLDSGREDLHDSVEDVQEAAVAVTEHAVNVTDPETYEKHTAKIEESITSMSSANSTLPDARAATVKAREEARRIELDNIRKDTEEQHKQDEAAVAAQATEGQQDEEGPSGNSNGEDVNDDISAKDALKALGANARVPLLKELVEATRDHTAQTTKYAELALQLQRDRLVGNLKNMTKKSNDNEDEESAEDQAVIDEEKKESEEEKLLLAPGRAQARAHCSTPELKVAGFKWCVSLQQCLQTWEHECPGGEWNGAMKKEVNHLTDQLKDLRRQHVQSMIDTLRSKLEGIKSKAGIVTPQKATSAIAMPSPVIPAGPGEYGRLKGHVLQLRLQIQKYAKELKVPVPEDPYASKHLPVPTEYQHGVPAVGGSQGQSTQASQLAARLSSLVNEIATTKNRSAIALMNREVDAILSKLRTMTLGAHCLRCGKAHCDVHEGDAMLWPALPTSGPPSLLKQMCGCHSLANPKCSCPKKSCAPPPPKKKNDCECKKKKTLCSCGGPPPCGGKGEPRCVTPPVMCEDPGTPMHSVRLGQTYTEGSKLQFLCQPPYKLVGDEFRTCSVDARNQDTPTGDGNGGWRRAGDWTGVQPTCVPPSCPKPRDIEDGVMIGSDFRFPAKVEFKCNVGYTREGVETMQCLGSGQWNSSPPKCYPLQKPSAGLTAVFDAGREEANELAKEMGIEQMEQRDPNPEEEKEDEDKKEKEAEDMMKEKSSEESNKRKKKEEEDKRLKEKAVKLSMENSNQVGSLEQLEHVAKHAQLELKRAEANRKDVEALVLANSASTSMAEAYGNTANLLSGKDPIGAESAASKRSKIIKDLLDSGSPLYRDSDTIVDSKKQEEETRGRSAASAAAGVGTQFAQDLLNALMESQPKNPENEAQDQAERKQLLAQVSAAASKSGYKAGTEPGVDDEASAIKAGKIAGAQSAAEVIAPILGMTAEDVLKTNQDKLEKNLRHAMSAINNEPSSPAELAASSTEGAIEAAEKMENKRELEKKQLEKTKENAVKAVQKQVEAKFNEAEDTQTGEKISSDKMEEAAVQSAENAVKQQLDVISEEQVAKNGNNTDASSTISNQLTNQVTQSIADEAVASVLKAAKEQEDEGDASGPGAGTPAERIEEAEEKAKVAALKQEKAQEEFAQKNALHQQEINSATERVNQEKAQKEIVEQTKRVEEANDEASFDNSIKQVEQVDPELTAPEESTAFFLRR